MDLVPADDVPHTGSEEILQGQDENGRIASLIYGHTPVLRRMAVFDAIFNDADGKGDHVAAIASRHLSGWARDWPFHSDHKLRAVLWLDLGDVERRGALGC